MKINISPYSKTFMFWVSKIYISKYIVETSVTVDCLDINTYVHIWWKKILLSYIEIRP